MTSAAETFDPKVHLQYAPPQHKYTFADLALPKSPTSTDIAATSPFSFLSSEGVRAYRRAIATTDVLQNCSYSPYKKTLVLRNVAEYSKFVHDLWTHPETLKIIHEVAGVPLAPVIPYEIGQTNMQVRGSSVEEMIKELASEPSTATRELTEEEKAFDPLTEQGIIPWHYDSYPYVLVVMLSNTTGMRGGETYLRRGDGTPVKVEGPSLGHCIFLQGGEVQHLAARAVGVDERIATITSLRAEVPGLYDSSYLTNVRPVSNLPAIYNEWIDYRLEKMKQEIANLQSTLKSCKGPVDVGVVHRFAETQRTYLRRTADQMVEYDLHAKTMNIFGKDAYYAVEERWSRMQTHPDFKHIIQTYDDSKYRPGSRLWADLYTSRAAIASGRTLNGQLGIIKWDKERDRPYLMGDELLRQGLREEFFEWLTLSGLSRLFDGL